MNNMKVPPVVRGSLFLHIGSDNIVTRGSFIHKIRNLRITNSDKFFGHQRV
jgi:hypothetical protein